jgi:hypothetical protein
VNLTLTLTVDREAMRWIFRSNQEIDPSIDRSGTRLVAVAVAMNQREVLAARMLMLSMVAVRWSDSTVESLRARALKF